MAGSSFPMKLQIRPKGEEDITLFVHYLHAPNRCEKCEEFGHQIGEGVECGKTMVTCEMAAPAKDVLSQPVSGSIASEGLLVGGPSSPAVAQGIVSLIGTPPIVVGKVIVTTASASSPPVDADGFQLVGKKGKAVQDNQSA
ncbi:unnamed protein product [Linum trigynum]|uniref:Uncharacterized protein n=1 Tax=Linum trigynum TaxID=586398 RepID=A0AAV2G7H0_9ROSI